MLATPRRLAVAGPLTIMFSVACWGQTTAFEGDVKGEDGKPLVKVPVHLDRKDIKGNYKVTPIRRATTITAACPSAHTRSGLRSMARNGTRSTT